jgi:rhodanese-related sulfurtransferase
MGVTLYRLAALGFALVLLMALGGCGGGVSDKDIKRVSLGEVRSLVERGQTNPNTVLLVDPRPPSQYAAGHIAGARSMELPPMDQKRLGRDPALAAYQTIVVYGNDPASAIAVAMTKRLMALEYDGVRLFAGGLKEWTERGLPVETE